jgi:hypothetical protein
MADAAPRKRNNNSALAVIVISLLVIMGLIAFVDRDDSRQAADSGVTMGMDRGGDGAVMPTPAPGTPAPGEGPEPK